MASAGGGGDGRHPVRPCQHPKAQSPLGVDVIEPADVAPAVVFLASDAARVIAGSTVDVTDGDSANNMG